MFGLYFWGRFMLNVLVERLNNFSLVLATA